MSPDLAAAVRLHFELDHGLVEKGVVPSNAELCARLACTPTQLEAHFETLAAEHEGRISRTQGNGEYSDLSRPSL